MLLKNKIFFSGSILFLFLFVLSAPLSADIYKYVDEKGVLHFTNVPVSNNYEIYVRDYYKGRRKSPVRVYSSDSFDNIISSASLKYGVAFPLVKAIIKAESDFDPKAVSEAGARGLMQIMPANFESLRINNPLNPFENVLAGTQ